MRRTLVGIALAGLGLIAAAPASATFPGANGRIVYDTTPPGAPPVIHTVLPSGSGRKVLGPGLMPSWSADGQRIVFSRGVNDQAEIYSMAADGSDLRRLTHSRANDLDPSYSPNGRKIIFESNAGIVVMKSNGSDQRVLVRGAGSHPTYSPDGKRIAYLVGRTAKHAPSIWVMRPNGSHKHLLLYLGSDGGSGPSYSPGGNKITFSRCSEHCGYFVARSDGTKVRRLPCPADYFRGITAPSYSPDGRRLLGETGQVDVVTLPLHSCSPKVVVSLSESDAALPDWQPVPAL